MPKGNESFEQQAMPHMNALYRAAAALSRNAQQAEDLVQETYVKALQSFDSFRPGTNCKAWLMRILRNLWIDQLRRNATVRFGQWPEELDAAAPEARGPSEATAGAEGEIDAQRLLESFSDQLVLDALGELSEDQRLALLLVDVEGMDHAEVAGVLDVAVGTIKSRTSRARATLRNKLLEHARDLGFVPREKKQ